MKQSRRARRMDQHHKRHGQSGGLNLVSLMDIFTILVFFLLVTSSDTEVLPKTSDLELPESVAEQRSRETVVVMVTRDRLLVQGEEITTISAIKASETQDVPAIRAALTRIAERRLRDKPEEGESRGEVTIMGDRQLPYAVLKKIMASVGAADYGAISLAVLHVAPRQDS